MALVIRIRSGEIILYVAVFAHATHPEARNAAFRGFLERGVGKEETALPVNVKNKHQNLHPCSETNLAAYLQKLSPL